MVAYYNEIDPNAAEWLRQLIRVGAIAPGDVDERDIRDVTPNELRAYTQCHFFAGAGVWSYSLRQAGWPDDRPVWTGSPPCQPFSTAGKRKGADDDRDLWWAMFWLIQQCQPQTIFGEQVASKDGLAWWDVVQTDLEGANYAATAFDLCAAGVGAPHIRQRLFWVAVSDGSRWERAGQAQPKGWRCQAFPAGGGADSSSLANTQSSERGTQLAKDECDRENAGRHQTTSGTITCCQAGAGIVVDSSNERLSQPRSFRQPPHESQTGARLEPQCQRSGRIDQPVILGDSTSERPQGGTSPRPTGKDGQQCGRGSVSAGGSFWSDAVWLPCRDGKARPAKSGTFPLVDGVASDLVCSSDSCTSQVEAIQTEGTSEARRMRLKGYGNAIAAPLAAEFISSCMEIL